VLRHALDGVHAAVRPNRLRHESGGVAEPAADLEEPPGTQRRRQERSEWTEPRRAWVDIVIAALCAVGRNLVVLKPVLGGLAIQAEVQVQPLAVDVTNDGVGV